MSIVTIRSGAGLLLVLSAASEPREARCEALSRLEPSNRRHTGSSPQKKLAAGDEQRDDDSADTPQEIATGSDAAYFDADYEAKGLVGAGSFGMVLQCVSKRDGRVAAVKMVQDLADNRAEVARETAALAHVQQRGGHAAIVRFAGAYAHNGFHYIVTEFVAGESLFDFLAARRRVLLRQELSPAMDAWALGCLLYILLSGRHPFDLMGAATEEQVMQRVVAPDSVSFVHPAWAAVPGDVKALVRGLLEKDPRARLSVHDVLAHESVRRACGSDCDVDD
ncbi:hypothetical protein PybrP1_012353 [[Pythium] brassicae (nom. inval.)]|nr:hypothetical protein PybrP1_012353 [[Pythium] brassicae (nom. inval.)]